MCVYNASFEAYDRRGAGACGIRTRVSPGLDGVMGAGRKATTPVNARDFAKEAIQTTSVPDISRDPRFYRTDSPESGVFEPCGDS